MAWPGDTTVFEVNALVWVEAWSRRLRRRLTLATLPGEAWDEVCRPGVEAVWLMGVWERSPAGVAIALADPTLAATHHEALADLTDADVAGSPYCIRRYEVDDRLGGRDALAAARAELDRRGCRLVLDFVPNHVAPDHPWVAVHPELFVHGTDDDLARAPEAYLDAGAHVLAKGRDPYFPAWPDVVQLNAFSTDTAATATATLLDIGEQCDGVRCDMAMLLLRDVFARTWGDAAGEWPAREYWEAVLSGVHRVHPGMGFLAEAYWDLEWRLVELGFDACYDKRLYDRLAGHDVAGVRAHLAAPVEGQRHLVRFTENHDEPRAATTFGPAARAAAMVVATVPGTTLWHEGQAEGHRQHLPVMLSRRPEEPDDAELRAFHGRLWEVAAGARRGEWAPASRSGWPDNPSHEQLLAWTWTAPDAATVMVVNFADRPAAGHVQVPAGFAGMLAGEPVLIDGLTGARYAQDPEEVARRGLFVDLGPWQGHILSTTHQAATALVGTSTGAAR